MITMGGVPEFAEANMMSPSVEPEDGALAPRIKRRKSTKGWDGEELASASVRTADPFNDSGTIVGCLHKNSADAAVFT